MGKTIRLYLVDGNPNGILTAEIINWTGSVLSAPRTKLSQLAKRDEVTKTGVYFLIGQDPENMFRNRVYIGEADNVMSRLVSHDKDEKKDFWINTVVITSKDQNLTKAHARYLESRIITQANKANKSILANNTSPDLPMLPESDKSDMDFFFEQIGLVLPVLGFSFLQKSESLELSSKEPGVQHFSLVQGKIKANATANESEFIILKGSKARKEGMPSWTAYRELREQLVKEQKLIDDVDPELYQFNEDVAFASPSAAAVSVLARNANGRTNWKIQKTGQTYQAWMDSKLRFDESRMDNVELEDVQTND